MINQRNWGLRRDLTIAMSGSTPITNAKKEFESKSTIELHTLSSEKVAVPPEVNKKRALMGDKHERFQFGGIFGFCDNTWLDQKEKSDALVKVGIAPTYAVKTRRMSI